MSEKVTKNKRPREQENQDDKNNCKDCKKYQSMQFQDLLLCRICLDLMKDPSVLECGHCFCSKCCASLDKCPTCRNYFRKRTSCFILKNLCELLESNGYINFSLLSADEAREMQMINLNRQLKKAVFILGKYILEAVASAQNIIYDTCKECKGKAYMVQEECMNANHPWTNYGYSSRQHQNYKKSYHSLILDMNETMKEKALKLLTQLKYKYKQLKVLGSVHDEEATTEEGDNIWMLEITW